jgi:hypothetical protein
MNFNVVSPSDNGHDYTIQFRDHLSIKPNSTIKLNYIELVRDKEVLLDEDASITMTVESADCLPNLVPSTQVANKVFDTQTSTSKSATIAKGTYTFIAFRDAIEATLVSLVNDTNFVDNYEVYVDNNQNEADLLIGIYPRSIDDSLIPVGKLTQFDVDITNNLDSRTSGAGGGNSGFAYIGDGNAKNGTYNNYAIGDVHYNHYRDNSVKGSSSFASNELQSTAFNSYAYLQSSHTIAEAEDNSNLIYGLYSEEYALGITPIPAPNRTEGINLKLDVNGQPKCFVSFEFSGRDGIIIRYAQSVANQQINVWSNLNQEIGLMNIVARIPVNEFDMTSNWSVVVGTEIDNTQDKPQIILKLGKFNFTQGIFTPLWNSNTPRLNLPFELMVSDEITYNNANNINSQMPFSPFCSLKQVATSTLTNFGWSSIEYRGFDKDTSAQGSYASDANPQTLCKNIKLTFSENIRKGLGIPENVNVRPNIYTTLNPDLLEADLDYTYKKRNYSVELNLPINNYKNQVGLQNTQENSALQKNVIANIPSAFGIGAIVESSLDTNLLADSSREVISVFQPYNPIVSDMDNPQIETNNIHFRLTDMTDGTLATEISRSIINFTIDEPK